MLVKYFFYVVKVPTWVSPLAELRKFYKLVKHFFHVVEVLIWAPVLAEF